MKWYKDNIALQAELRREYPAVAGLIDSLKAELEEATKQKSDWHNMYQETYDELSSVQQAILVETERIKAAWREIAILERQLAEARAENVMLRGRIGTEINGKFASQSAAEECIKAIEAEHGVLGLAFTLRQRFGLDEE